MPTRAELIAHRHTVDEIREQIGADTLGYLSLDGLRRVSEVLKQSHCDACFSDEYPVPIAPSEEVPQLSLFRPVEVDDDGDAE